MNFVTRLKKFFHPLCTYTSCNIASILFYRPLVQKKLDVLNKAGLSKDNFSAADTLHVKVNNKWTDRYWCQKWHFIIQKINTYNMIYDNPVFELIFHKCFLLM